MFILFFVKQKTSYEMRISDWSSTCALPIFPFQLGAYNLQLTGVHECNKRFEGAWHEFPRRSKFARELGLLQGCGHLRQEFFEEFGRRLPHAYEWRRKRSEARRVGNECGRTYRSGWWP